MTPLQLCVQLDAYVHGKTIESGKTTEGYAWELRDHPGTSGYRLTVAVPAKTHEFLIPHVDSEVNVNGWLLLGLLRSKPSMQPMFDLLRTKAA